MLKAKSEILTWPFKLILHEEYNHCHYYNFIIFRWL